MALIRRIQAVHPVPAPVPFITHWTDCTEPLETAERTSDSVTPKQWQRTFSFVRDIATLAQKCSLPRMGEAGFFIHWIVITAEIESQFPPIVIGIPAASILFFLPIRIFFAHGQKSSPLHLSHFPPPNGATHRPWNEDIVVLTLRKIRMTIPLGKPILWARSLALFCRNSRKIENSCRRFTWKIPSKSVRLVT